MGAWTAEELQAIGHTDELELASQRPDGTLRKPVVMWVVRDGDGLYVRSMHGRSGAWFRGTQDRHQGRVHCAGIDKDVAFTDTDPADTGLEERIDAAYRSKYHRYGDRIVGGVVNPDSRASTLRLDPR